MSQVRAQRLLAVVGAVPATRAASGRYQRSIPFAPGSRWWATTLETTRVDKFGVQFLGPGIETARAHEREFVRRGFVKQSTQPTQVTFCRKIPRLPDDGIDEAAIRAAKSEIQAILARAPDGAPKRTGADLIAFLRESPLAEVELPDVPRDGEWRRIDI